MCPGAPALCGGRREAELIVGAIGFLGAPPRPCFQASSATRIAKSAPRWSLIFLLLSIRAWDPAKFRQSTHLHLAPQITPAWKHSQYFFRHSERLQRQPMLCPLCGELPVGAFLTLKRGLNAFGFFARVSLMALSRIAPAVGVLPQSVQLQS